MFGTLPKICDCAETVSFNFIPSKGCVDSLLFSLYSFVLHMFCERPVIMSISKIYDVLFKCKIVFLKLLKKLVHFIPLVFWKAPFFWYFQGVKKETSGVNNVNNDLKIKAPIPIKLSSRIVIRRDLFCMSSVKEIRCFLQEKKERRKEKFKSRSYFKECKK